MTVPLKHELIIVVGVVALIPREKAVGYAVRRRSWSSQTSGLGAETQFLKCERVDFAGGVQVIRGLELPQCIGSGII